MRMSFEGEELVWLSEGVGVGGRREGGWGEGY